MLSDLPALLGRAAARREPTRARSDAYRLVDDEADGLPGIVVDCYGEFAVLQTLSEAGARVAKDLARVLARGLPGLAAFRGVYLKRRVKADLRHVSRETLAPELPIEGEPAPAELMVHEDGLSYAVSLGDGLSTGLFTDQRDGRALVRREAAGARVLNLFAYTCSFTVAAARGGAKETTSVDVSQRALTRGARNLEHNGLAGPSHRILRADAVAFAARARRRGDLFDLVVLDPPTFGTHGKSTFSVERDYPRVCEDALALLAPGGCLLAVTNHQGTSRGKLRRTVLFAADRLGLQGGQVTDLEMPEDHPDRPQGFEPTKSVLYRRS